MSRKNTTPEHHEPDDPDIAEAMRARREELGLSMPEISGRAGVSEQTWRNYESGRTRVRSDKQLRVWEALQWEPPVVWSGLLGGGVEDIVRRVMDNPELLGSPVRQDTGVLGMPEWGDIPSALPEGYSPLLAATLGENAARCFALGAHLYDLFLAEDLEKLAVMPRGAHLGELEESHLGGVLPPLWLTRYDYEFVFQLRGIIRDLQYRLVRAGVGRDEPLARSLAEILVVHDVFTLGGVMSAPQGAAIDDDEWEGWVNALTGPDETAHRLFGAVAVPPLDAAEHVENWFRLLAAPFVPAWRLPGSPPGGGGATVTRLRRR
ncbi:helix-turn-helix domain-containing protein [uncultured Propionibacterium sp.]|uniref:helix-turn-helix domain-containing protein n=1 Tax=uncultured Propionibacterium sp. TaxID=218066 RepID=UPI002930BF91|nr:helix-turn-helix domain-containing protein [uncultured Propionibacterium sp.]